MAELDDKKRSLINVTVSVAFKVILLFLSFIVRRFLINTLGNEYNGINSLYLSLIGFLAVAELGIGTAITFCMYKPIVDNDNKKVVALYCLFKKVYNIISVIVLVGGIIISFFLPYFAKDYSVGKNQLYYFFYLFLFSSVLTYFTGAKSSLICAYKNNFISTTILSVSTIVQNVLQIISLLVFKSFYAYLISKSIGAILQYALLTVYCRLKYPDIVKEKSILDDESKKEVKKNIGALCLHQIGAVIFSSVDSVIISSLFGVIILGKYSNYFLILQSMNEVLKLIFVPLTSIIGQMMVKSDVKEIKNVYQFLNYLNIALGITFYLGYFAIVDELVELCFGTDLAIDKNITIVLSITYFCQYLRQACANFKDSAGLFYKDRFIAIISAVLNIGLSILLAKLINDVTGVLIATLIIVVFVYHPIDIYVLYKYKFSDKFYFDYIYKLIVMGCFTGLVILMSYIKLSFSSLAVEIIVNGFISVGISLAAIALLESFALKDIFKNIKQFVSSFKRKKIQQEEDI